MDAQTKIKLRVISTMTFHQNGIDEVLAYGICNLYGSIALTNYGYIDKCKPGIIEKLNRDHAVNCHTFLDDSLFMKQDGCANKNKIAGYFYNDLSQEVYLLYNVRQTVERNASMMKKPSIP